MALCSSAPIEHFLTKTPGDKTVQNSHRTCTINSAVFRFFHTWLPTIVFGSFFFVLLLSACRASQPKARFTTLRSRLHLCVRVHVVWKPSMEVDDKKFRSNKSFSSGTLARWLADRDATSNYSARAAWFRGFILLFSPSQPSSGPRPPLC